LAELVAESLRPIREKYREIMKDPQYIEDILARGAEKANAIAQQTLRRAKERVGLG